MVTAVRTNAFQAPSLKQHENGLRSVEDAFRQAQRHARQAQQPQQQRGAQGGPRGHPVPPAVAKQPVDLGETFQRPSPGDSNNSETTASTPPSVTSSVTHAHASSSQQSVRSAEDLVASVDSSHALGELCKSSRMARFPHTLS